MSKKIKLDYFKKIALPKLEKENLLVSEFSPSCFRITDGIKTVDYYPKSNRLFSHEKQQWLDVSENVTTEILVQIFPNLFKL